MKLTMLGTGHATVTDCYNTCFVFSEDHQHFLVDTGGGNGILKALKQAEIPLEEIHDIFITHEHIDHMLGVLWMIRIIGTMMEQGTYEGALSIYCHTELLEKICTMAEMTIHEKVCKHIGKDIIFVDIDHGDQLKLLNCDITFFDIESTKARQLGFTMITSSGLKLSCLGDEPYNPRTEIFVKDSDWLMHDAFCLDGEEALFRAHEKHHSTVKDACETASRLQVTNLILYHTEETHLENRRELYQAEGSKYFSGNIYVPDDLDTFEIKRSLKFPG